MSQNEASEQEARLKRIIQKQEAKLKSIWDENKKLTQKAELAQLDYEIASEQSQFLQDELKSVQAKLRELEELRGVSEELEITYAADNLELRQQCEALQTQLKTAHGNVQNLEVLRLELRDSQRLVQVLNLEIDMIKNGAVKALGPSLEPAFPNADFLHLIDHLNLNMDQSFRRYREGEISLTTLGQELSEQADKALLDVSIIELTEVPENNPHLARLLKAKQQLAVVPPEMPVEVPHTHSDDCSDSQLNETYKLRISVLESKLQQAESISYELERLESAHKDALFLQEELKQNLATCVDKLEQKEAEIAALEKNNLPGKLLSTLHKSEMSSLNHAIKFLSSQSPNLQLHNLDAPPQLTISRFARDPQVRRFRDVAPSFKLGTTPTTARDLAVEQQMRLTFF